MTKQEFIDKTLEVLQRGHISHIDDIEEYDEISIKIKRSQWNPQRESFNILVAYDEDVTFATAVFKTRIPYSEIENVETYQGILRFCLKNGGSIRTGALARK